MSLIALDVAIEIVTRMRPLLARLLTVDRNLEDEGRRASTSIALNTAEGSRRVGRDRPHAFSIAAGSAKELQTVLRVAVAFGYLTAEEIGDLPALIDRELGLLFGLMRSASSARAWRTRDRSGPAGASPPRR
jgi:four helix bundle protein